MVLMASLALLTACYQGGDENQMGRSYTTYPTHTTEAPTER